MPQNLFLTMSVIVFKRGFHIFQSINPFKPKKVLPFQWFLKNRE